MTDPQAQNLLAGIHSRVVAAVNLEKLEDKIEIVINNVKEEGKTKIL